MSESGPEPNRASAVAFDVTPLGRRRRRLDPGLILVVLAAILVAAALTRPWANGPSPASVAADPVPTAGQPSDRPATFASASASGVWAVGAGSWSKSFGQPASVAPLPWMYSEIDWSAWLAVDPGTTHAPAGRLADLPPNLKAADLCAGLPRLPAGAQVIAISAPSGRSADVLTGGWGIRGFRDDPPVIGPLAGLARITPFRTGDLIYLRQGNGQPWPAGRYAFRIAGPAGTTLSVCLGEP